MKEPFSRRAISTYSETIARLTDEMLDTWRPGEVRDIAEEMRRYMLQVTSTLLFGLDEPELALRLGDMIAEWVSMNDELGAGALVPNETFSKRYEELLAYAEKLEAEILRMIRRRRESQRDWAATCSRSWCGCTTKKAASRTKSWSARRPCCSRPPT